MNKVKYKIEKYLKEIDELNQGFTSEITINDALNVRESIDEKVKGLCEVALFRKKSKIVKLFFYNSTRNELLREIGVDCPNFIDTQEFTYLNEILKKLNAEVVETIILPRLKNPTSENIEESFKVWNACWKNHFEAYFSLVSPENIEKFKESEIKYFQTGENEFYERIRPRVNWKPVEKIFKTPDIVNCKNNDIEKYHEMAVFRRLKAAKNEIDFVSPNGDGLSKHHLFLGDLINSLTNKAIETYVVPPFRKTPNKKEIDEAFNAWYENWTIQNHNFFKDTSSEITNKFLKSEELFFIKGINIKYETFEDHLPKLIKLTEYIFV